MSKQNYVRGLCRRCHLPRTPEGHDSCLGTLPGVRFACCGHGLGRGYVAFTNGMVIRGHFDRDQRGAIVVSNPPAWFLERAAGTVWQGSFDEREAEEQLRELDQLNAQEINNDCQP